MWGDREREREGASLGGTYIFLLVVLENTAKGALSGAQSSVQCMNISLLQISSFLNTITNLEGARLIIEAVGARDKFLELLLEWEPGLEIIFLGCCIVQCARNNGDNLVREAQGLVELLRGRHHVFKGLP